MRSSDAKPRRSGTSLAARALGAAAVVTVAVLAMAAPAHAHPLGNFTINTSAALRIRPDEVLVDYVIDEAEVPTLQARPDIDADGDDDLSPSERERYASARCASATEAIAVTVGGSPVTMEVRASDVTFPPGQAGLDTMRIRCQLLGGSSTISSSTALAFTDDNFADRLGWREVVAQGDRTTITESDVGERSTSKRLTAYPEKQIQAPLDQRSANLTVEPGGDAVAAPATGPRIPLPSADRLTDLLKQRTLTIPFGLFAVAVSFILGGFHALAPGHGKTVMAAYLVGQRGARRQALILGATVAFTHTGGVMALALVATNSSIAPERFYPILGTFSGVLVVGIGVVLLRRAVQFRRLFPTLGPDAHFHSHHGIGGHTHSHDDDPHDHSDHDHDHGDHKHIPSGHAHEHAGHQHDGRPHAHPGHAHAHEDLAGLERQPVGTAVTATAPVALADHSHSHEHEHEHQHEHEHEHEHEMSTAAPEASTSSGPIAGGPVTATPAMDMRGMMAMGFAGGLVPSPSALVVLLGSIAIGRAWFGFVLIISYGAGLAAVLVGAGLIIERLRHRIEPFLARRKRSRLTGLAVNLPVITAVLVVLGGGYLVARALLVA